MLYNLLPGLSYPAGLVSDRLNRRVVFATGLVFFAVAYLGFGLAGTAPWLWVLFPIYGAYTAVTDGVGRAWVADLVPADNRGTALGIHAAVSAWDSSSRASGLDSPGTAPAASPSSLSGIAVFGIALVRVLSRTLSATQTEQSIVAPL